MRKTYERDFKMKVVQEINAKKVTVKAVSDEYSIARPIVSRWVLEYCRYGKKDFTGKGSLTNLISIFWNKKTGGLKRNMTF